MYSFNTAISTFYSVFFSLSLFCFASSIQRWHKDSMHTHSNNSSSSTAATDKYQFIYKFQGFRRKIYGRSFPTSLIHSRCGQTLCTIYTHACSDALHLPDSGVDDDGQMAWAHGQHVVVGTKMMMLPAWLGTCSADGDDCADACNTNKCYTSYACAHWPRHHRYPSK